MRKGKGTLEFCKLMRNGVNKCINIGSKWYSADVGQSGSFMQIVTQIVILKNSRVSFPSCKWRTSFKIIDADKINDLKSCSWITYSLQVRAWDMGQW